MGDDYTRLIAIARSIARHHLAEAQAEGLEIPADTDAQDRLVDQEAKRVLRNAVTEIEDQEAA